MARDKKDVAEILKRTYEGNYKLTSEDFDAILETYGDASAQNKIKKELGIGSTEELIQQMSQILNSADNSQNYFARLERKMKRGEVTEELATGLNALRDLTQFGIGAGQAAQSDRALSRLRRPNAPTTPMRDPYLDQAISGAQLGTMDAARQIEPARQELQRGFYSDLAAARGAVGGQGAAYGALAQNAALRRNRAIGELAPIMDNIRGRQQSRVDELMARRQAMRQQDFSNRLQLYDYENQAYNQDVGAAAELGLAGRENMYGALGNLPDSIAAFGGTMYGRQLGRRPASQRSSVPPEDRTQVPELDAFQEELINTSLLYNPARYQRQTPYYNNRNRYA
jgi:hypothetical protein